MNGCWFGAGTARILAPRVGLGCKQVRQIVPIVAANVPISTSVSKKAALLGGFEAASLNLS